MAPGRLLAAWVASEAQLLTFIPQGSMGHSLGPSAVSARLLLPSQSQPGFQPPLLLLWKLCLQLEGQFWPAGQGWLLLPVGACHSPLDSTRKDPGGKGATNKGIPLRPEVLPPGATSLLNTSLSMLGDDLWKPPFACLGI